jgi:hypothetical protein
MTTAMQAVRRQHAPELDRSALRVAIARAGRIEREWVVTSGTITVGRSDDADVFVASHPIERLTLVRIEDGEMTLAIPSGASGRVQLASGPRELAGLAGTSLVLDAAARGRIVLSGSGEEAVALLFQRVAAPLVRSRPELPAAVRGGLFDRVDWLFTALAAASFMLHLAFVVGMSNADWPVPPSLAVVDARVADIVFADATMPPMPTLTDPTDPSDVPPSPTDPTEPSHVDSPRPSHPSTPSPRPSAPEVDPSIAVDHAVDTALQTLIGAHGLDGALADVLNNGGPTQSSAEVLASAQTVEIASSTDVPMRSGHVTGVPDGTFGPRSIGGRPGERGEGDPVVEAAPRPVHITVEPIDDPVDPAVFDDEQLRRALRARMPAIQQCYETQITHTPGLAGRISVSMQVERIGSVSHVEAVDDTVGSRALSECVLNNVRTIRVRIGPTEPVTVEYPLVFAPQS